MAARLTLVKGPTLQKLLVLTLLTLAGLPPPLCDAIKCFQCQKGYAGSPPGDCTKPEECFDATACMVHRETSADGKDVKESKKCDKVGGAGLRDNFECIQKKLGTEGSPCIKLGEKEFGDKLAKCQEGKHRDGPGAPPTGSSGEGMQEYCVCDQDGCNTDELGELGKGPGSTGTGGDGKGGNGAGSVEGTGLRIGIIGGMLTLLATNRLFY